MATETKLRPTPTGPHGAVRHSAHHRPVCETWRFKLLYLVMLMVSLPLVAVARLLPGHSGGAHEKSVFVEASNTVMIALGYTFNG